MSSKCDEITLVKDIKKQKAKSCAGLFDSLPRLGVNTSVVGC